MNPDTLKQAICDALATFIRSRPGFEYANYGDAASYRADVRRAARQKRDAETMLAAVRWRDSITGADLIEAARGERLTIEATRVEYPNQLPTPYGYRVRIDYCAGQYYPTEYRAGVCRVLANALWNWQRENMPAPYAHRVEWPRGEFAILQLHAMTEARNADPTVRVYDLYRIPGRPDGSVSAGDWLRRKFRAEFGSALQRRWFD